MNANALPSAILSAPRCLRSVRFGRRAVPENARTAEWGLQLGKSAVHAHVLAFETSNFCRSGTHKM
jgi:hypothetical protein